MQRHHHSSAASGGVLAAPPNSQSVNEVILLRDHCIAVGRPLAMVIGPILDSILDTIFWGDGYKSLAHVVLLSFGWWKGVVGLRFIMLLLYFHLVTAVVLSRRRRSAAAARGGSGGDRGRSGSEERRAALFAYRACTAYMAELVTAYPYAFFVLPQGTTDRRKLHLTVAAVTAVVFMLWFPKESRSLLNGAIFYVTSVATRGTGGIEEALPAISVYDVLDMCAAPVTILSIIVGGLGKIGPKDPRCLVTNPPSSSAAASTSAAAASHQHGATASFPAFSPAPTAPSSPHVAGSGGQPTSAAAASSGGLHHRIGSAFRPLPAAEGAADVVNASSSEAQLEASQRSSTEITVAGGALQALRKEIQSHQSGDVAASALLANSSSSDPFEVYANAFLTKARMNQLIGEDFSFNDGSSSQTRREILLPLLRVMCPHPNAASPPPPYWMQPTPDGEWDALVPRMPTLPTHAHKILALLVKGPNWSQWKRMQNKPERRLPSNSHNNNAYGSAAWRAANPIGEAEVNDDDILVLNHPTSFSQVKCGFNRVRVRGVKFDDVVAWLSDDIFKENGEPAKPTKDLNVFKYDALLSEYRRLACHTYTLDTPDGPVSAVAKVIHFVYKQMVFGVAARDCPMFTTARELTEAELRHYGLFGEHATTFYPRRVVPTPTSGRSQQDGETASPDRNGASASSPSVAQQQQPLGRVFLVSSSPAANVPQAPGHVTATIHRHAILVICPPRRSDCGDAEDDEHDIVDICTMMCGEPGGKIPSFAVEIGRGEQLKVVTSIYNSLVADMKEAGLCSYPDNHKK